MHGCSTVRPDVTEVSRGLVASTCGQCWLTSAHPAMSPSHPEIGSGFFSLFSVPVGNAVGSVLLFSSWTSPGVYSSLAAGHGERGARPSEHRGMSPSMPMSSSRACLLPPLCSPPGGVATEPPGVGGLAFQPARAAPTYLLLSLQEAAQWHEDVRV